MKTNSFDELYREVPAAQREQLRQFRASHPYQHLEVDGVQWEYIASGQGQQALLILGGGMSVGETAFQTILRLENRFRVFSPSYPPVGKMRPVADGLSAILAQEGFSQAHVFGHSLGAGVGHVFIRLYPSRVDKLVLDGFGLYTPGHTRAAKLFFKLPFPVLKWYYRRVFRRLLAGTGDAGLFMRAYVEELFEVLHTRETLMGQFYLLFDIFDQVEAYGIFKPVERPGRVLLMLAEDDRGFTPAEREALKISYPGARIHTFTQGGHLSGFTHPQEFNAILDGFLEQS